MKFDVRRERESFEVGQVIHSLTLTSSTSQLQVWDTGGQERYHAVTRSYYHKADAIILVYDINRAETFNSVPYWLGEVNRYAKADVHCLLVGNKSDLVVQDEWERQVTMKEGRRFAQKNGMQFFESTATNQDNIHDLFLQLAKMLLDKEKEATATREINTIAIVRDNPPKKRGKKCCEKFT